MTPRLNIFEVAPEGAKVMLELGGVLASNIEHSLIELIKTRASQINGCAFCIHMHVKDAVKHGETDIRLHMLNAWRESPLFTDRERAALAWTDTLTLVADKGAPDADYALVKSQFSEKEIGYLTLVVANINAWNRVQIGLRAIHAVGQSDLPIASAV
jgi:AhpD family alkylhydroperoxidase